MYGFNIFPAALAPQGHSFKSHWGFVNQAHVYLWSAALLILISFWGAKWWIHPGLPFQTRSLNPPKRLSTNSLSILISFSPLSSPLLSGPWRSAQWRKTQNISTKVHQWDFHYVSRCHHWKLQWLPFQKLNRLGVLGIPGSLEWKPLLTPLFHFSIFQIVSPGSKDTILHLHWFISLPSASDSLD